MRDAADAAGRTVAVLADLQGPKIRLGRFADGPVEWHAGDTVRITVDDVPGTHDRVSTTYAALAADAKPGDRLLVDDGRVGLEVLDVEGPDVVCTVTVGGTGVQQQGPVPARHERVGARPVGEGHRGPRVRPPPRRGLVALSFVRSPADIDLVHAVMDRVGRRAPVIAKLEKPEAVDDLEAVVDAFDGIMVARGDLGVELPLERVPLVQKRAVQLCREKAKPVIVATQMLDSMIDNPRPTRAEASDVANAVLDGADAVMLSGETSVGAYPLETVRDHGADHRGGRVRPDGRRPAAAPAGPHATRPARPGRAGHRATASTPRRWSPSRCPATPSGGWRGCIHGSPLIAITPIPRYATSSR